jgi:hypothetical protein
MRSTFRSLWEWMAEREERIQDGCENSLNEFSMASGAGA